MCHLLFTPCSSFMSSLIQIGGIDTALLVSIVNSFLSSCLPPPTWRHFNRLACCPSTCHNCCRFPPSKYHRPWRLPPLLKNQKSNPKTHRPPLPASSKHTIVLLHPPSAQSTFRVLARLPSLASWAYEDTPDKNKDCNICYQKRL